MRQGSGCMISFSVSRCVNGERQTSNVNVKPLPERIAWMPLTKSDEIRSRTLISMPYLPHFRVKPSRCHQSRKLNVMCFSSHAEKEAVTIYLSILRFPRDIKLGKPLLSFSAAKWPFIHRNGHTQY